MNFRRPVQHELEVCWKAWFPYYLFLSINFCCVCQWSANNSSKRKKLPARTASKRARVRLSESDGKLSEPEEGKLAFINMPLSLFVHAAMALIDRWEDLVENLG